MDRIPPFDDLLYLGTEWLNHQKTMTASFLKTDEFFLSKCYEIYNEIEDGYKNSLPTIFINKKDTGFTTALMFCIYYYSLIFKDIKIMTSKQELNKTKLVETISLVSRFSGINISCDVKANQILIKKDGRQISEISIHNINMFDIANINGCVFFVDCKPLKNIDKYNDLIKNFTRCDRLVLNFPSNEFIDKLAMDNQLKIKSIKIF